MTKKAAKKKTPARNGTHARAPRAVQTIGPGDDDEDDADDDADEDQDEEEGAADEPEILSAEDAAKLDAVQLIEQIGSSGAGAPSLRIKFRRILRPEDQGIPGVSAGFVGSFPSAKVRQIQADRLEDDMMSCFGGGSFGLDFFFGGEYQRGWSKQIDIAGPARPRLAGELAAAAPIASGAEAPGAGPLPSAATAAAGPTPSHGSGPVTAADVARLVAEQLEAAGTRAKLAALEKENEELRMAPFRGEPRASEVSVKDLADLVFKQTKTMVDQLHGAAAESPEAKLARERAERAEQRNQELEKKLQEAERQENTARFDRIEKLIRRKKDKKSPIVGAATGILELVASVTALKKLGPSEREGSEEVESPIVQRGLSVLDQIAGEYMNDFIQNMRKKPKPKRIPEGGNSSAAKGVPVQPVTAASEVDHKGWMEWVNAILENAALVQDARHVRAGIRLYGPHVNRLIMIETREALFSFVRETINKETAEVFEQAPHKDVVALLKAIGTLRGTVLSLAAAPAAAPEQESEPEAPSETAGAKVTPMPTEEPKAEDGEGDDSEAEDGDEDDDGEDEGPDVVEVEGKVVK